MLTLLLTGVSLFVVWVLWTYIVRPALEDFGIMPPLEQPPRGKHDRQLAMSARALADLDAWRGAPATHA